MSTSINTCRLRCRLALCGGLALSLLAVRADAYTVGSRTRGGGEIMTNEKVVNLSKAGVPEDIIMDMVENASRSQFDLTEKGVLGLQGAGVSPDVIRAMRKIYKEEIKQHDRTIRNMIQVIRSDDPKHYERAVRTLTAYGAYAVPLLLDNIGHEDERIRAGVCEILGRITDPPSLEPLMDALLDRNRAVRARAAKAVSRFEKGVVLNRIEKAVNNRGIPRDGYALALGYIGDLKQRDVLIRIADEPGPESDRAAAAYALGLLGDAAPKTVEVLIEATLSDTYRELREAAARALGRLAEKMEPGLRTETGLAMSKAMERYEASRPVLAGVLRHFPGRRTVETLLAYLGDRDRDVSTASWESLKEATGEAWPRDVDPWNSWWEIAQLQTRWQGERFMPGAAVETPMPEDDMEAAAPDVGLEDKPNDEETAPELGVRTPQAPEDPFVR